MGRLALAGLVKAILRPYERINVRLGSFLEQSLCAKLPWIHPNFIAKVQDIKGLLLGVQLLFLADSSGDPIDLCDNLLQSQRSE